MTQSWERVQNLFLEALEIAPEERPSFLDKACAGDDEVRREVESLLAHESDGEQIADALLATAQSFLESAAIKPGTRIGEYEVRKLLGSGGMGEVYQARDLRLARDVAIKVLPFYLTNHPERMRRFEQEARAAAALNHPNIVAVYQLGFYQGAPYIVTELLEGNTLRELIKRGPLPARDAVEYGIQIARGLAAAHGKGITHRDLKPENVFATRDGHVKILDFGLAKLSEQPGSDRAPDATETGLVLGTVGYMSPEQVRGQTTDYRTDFFAFGAILYEMLSGERAFRKPTAADTMSAILTEDPPDFSQLSPATPPALQRVMRRCLEKERERRFQSASDLAFALEALSDSGVSGAPAENAEPSGWQKRVRLTEVTAIAAFVVVLALAVAYWFRPTMPSPHISRIVQLTKSGGAWSKEPLYTDGPRVYYHSGGPLGGDSQLRQVSLNGNEDTMVSIPGGQFHIRGLSPDDTEFVALMSGQSTVWRIPVAGGSSRRVGNLVAGDIAWSHSGSWFAFSHDNELLVANSDGTSSRSLATVGDTSTFIDHIRWSPDDYRIRFTLVTPSTLTLWEIGADGSSLHELRFAWPGEPLECCGEWTPDGRYFVFRSNREGISNLWALQEKSEWWRRPNRDPVQLTSGPVNYYQPVPSRNGNSIFAIASQPSGELVRYDTDRKDFVAYLGGRSASHLAFSHDGRSLAYVSYPEGTLWRARTDGTEPQQLTFPPLQVGGPCWSVDGKWIAFHAFQPGKSWRNFVISSEGGNPEPFPLEFSQTSPNWIPGRDALTYSRAYGAENPALYLFDRVSGHSEKISGTDGLYGPFWSPDGRYLAAADVPTNHLVLVDLKSGKRTQLTGPVAWPAWSPDSRYIYFVRWGIDAIFRVHVPDGREEEFLKVPFRVASWPFTVAADGSLVLLREHGRSDVYALSLSVP